MLNWLASIGVAILFFASSIWYSVSDWAVLYNYQAPTEIASLKSEDAMTSKAEHIFYRANPEIDSRASLVQHCRIPSGAPLVELGCYSGGRIYIIQVNQPELKSEMNVVAAHEMLHAAYDRLSPWAKKKLNSELEQQVTTLNNASLNKRLQDYASFEPGARDNELHSILGTEYANLSADLEHYYSQYFQNRAQVVADNQEFNQVFSGLEDEISSLESKISSQESIAQARLQNGNVAGYNAMVGPINELINQYNADITRYNELAASLKGQQQGVGNR